MTLVNQTSNDAGWRSLAKTPSIPSSGLNARDASPGPAPDCDHHLNKTSSAPVAQELRAGAAVKQLLTSFIA